VAGALVAASASAVGCLAAAFAFLFREVGRRRRVEADLRASEHRLACALEASRMSVRSVSTAPRAPVRALDGQVEEHGDALGAESRRALDAIRGHARQMGRLIDGLLPFARLRRSGRAS
jgi:K+-sensing histidine kinase KdpD